MEKIKQPFSPTILIILLVSIVLALSLLAGYYQSKLVIKERQYIQLQNSYDALRFDMDDADQL